MTPDTLPLALSRTADSIPIAPPSDDPILPFASASADGSPRAPPPPARESLLLPNHPTTSGTVPMSAMSTVTRPTSPGLSSELRRILNLSSLDPDVRSVVLGRSALLGGGGGSSTPTGNFGSNAGAADVGATPSGSNAYSSNYVEDRRMERQYMWLERYHAHVAAQQQGQIHGASAGTAAGGGAAAGSSLDASGSAAGQPRRSQQAPPPESRNRPAQDEGDVEGSSYQPFGSIV
jgi:hypothetical protein